MEAETAHPPLTRRPPLASSWDAACGALAQSLHLTRSDLGARDADWEELLAPPATGCAGPAGTGVVIGASHAPGGAEMGGGGREGRGSGPGAEPVTGLCGWRGRGGRSWVAGGWGRARGKEEATPA